MIVVLGGGMRSIEGLVVAHVNGNTVIRSKGQRWQCSL